MFATIAGMVGWIFIAGLLLGAAITGLELIWYRLPSRKKSVNKDYKKSIALVTGASSGLGRMYSCLIYEKLKGVDEVWLVARRREQLEKTAELVPGKTRCISADLTDAEDLSILKKLLS